MVGKKTLIEYGFTDMYQYYDMCIDSKINGQHKQAVKQIKTLSKGEQRERFLEYIENAPIDIDLEQALKHILISL